MLRARRVSKSIRILLSLLVLVLLLAVGGFWRQALRQHEAIRQAQQDALLQAQQRQYALNRQLIEALVNNDTKTALALVNAGGDPNTRYKPTPAPSLKLLSGNLSHPVSPANDSPTAFMLACGVPGYLTIESARPYVNVRDDLALIQAMLIHGANVNAISTDGHTALVGAVLHRHADTMELLLKQGAKVDGPDYDGRTPLWWAINCRFAEKVGVLLDHGADVNRQTGAEGETPLMQAARDIDDATLRVLLAHHANVNFKDKMGRTALLWVQSSNHSNLVRMLKQAGATESTRYRPVSFLEERRDDRNTKAGDEIVNRGK